MVSMDLYGSDRSKDWKGHSANSRNNLLFTADKQAAISTSLLNSRKSFLLGLRENIYLFSMTQLKSPVFTVQRSNLKTSPSIMTLALTRKTENPTVNESPLTSF